MTGGVLFGTFTHMVLAVALSGGVDSAVAAVLLSKKYPRMVGASHVIWPDSRCCSTEVLNRARDVCRSLDIPYIKVDLYEQFRGQVVEDFIQTYLSGKTPNPCVVCNKSIRFDAFYSELARTLRQKDILEDSEELLFSTGHYARIAKTSDGYFIAKGKDPVKDQSYMLYQVDKGILPKLVLPLGEYQKSQILSMAEEMGLPYTKVKESQDACFVEDNYVQFIRGQTGSSEIFQTGDIVDPAGRVLGEHRGTINYTVGQRRGLGLGNGPWYVTRIDPRENRIVVARQADAGRLDFLVNKTNWFIDPPARPLECTVKIRYQIREVPCTVEPVAEDYRVVLDRPQIVTPGQSAVFYAEELVLGGGIID